MKLKRLFLPDTCGVQLLDPHKKLVKVSRLYYAYPSTKPAVLPPAHHTTPTV